jgi:hypothetical protein
MQLTLSSGATTITLNDGGTGFVSYAGAVNTWSLSFTAGVVGTNPQLHLNSLNTGSGTLTVTLSANGYTSPFLASFNANIGGALANGHTLTNSAFANAGSTLAPPTPGTGQIGSTLSFSNPPASAFSGSTSGGSIAANTPYTLTQVVVLSGSTIGSTSFDANIFAVPEPATVVLLGGVMVATFSSLRRRRNRV